MEYPELEVIWFENDPGANKWKYICKIIGHQWKPSHPHITICNRCGMNGLERYIKEYEGM